MPRLDGQDIERLKSTFDSTAIEEIEKAYGNIYSKLSLILDTEITKFQRMNVQAIVDEEGILDETICVLVENLYNDKIRNKAGYCITTLRRLYWRKVRHNMDPNHELHNDVYRSYKEYLDLLEQGEIDLPPDKIKSEIRQNTEIIRRIKRKAKAFKRPQISAMQKASEIESRHGFEIDRKKIRIALKNCLKKLTKEQRATFLKSIKTKKQREIAIKMNVTDSAITQSLKSARKSMSRCMASYGFKKEDLIS